MEALVLSRYTLIVGFICFFVLSTVSPIVFGYNIKISDVIEQVSLSSDGPLGEWPDFTPIGFITAPHPDYPQYQTHLYGDWGGIVGEEFIFLQDDMIKLLYHSYHETYMTEHTHEEEVLSNWALGYDPVTKIKYTPLVKPGGPYPGPAWEHTDTPGYIHHPLTGEHLIYNTVRPGTKHLHPEWEGLPGWEGAIQVATSQSPPTIGNPFEQTYENILVAEYWWEQGWNNNGVIKGGLSEPTPVWVPHLGTEGKVRLFYRGLHGSPSSYWNWRISYADSEDGKTNWVKNPIPTFDPSDPDNPAYQWTLPWPDGFSFRGAWQAHVTGDVRANGVHMILCVSNQNYAGFGHLAYYWSPDWGDTWIGHPNNPIIAPGQFPYGVPSEGFQRTPTLLIDEEYNRYILAYNAGHDINQQWKRRTYIATASRPENPPPEKPIITGPTVGAMGIEYNYTFVSSDPDAEDIYYYIDWGDGETEEWIGPYPSDEIITVSHIWSSADNYKIKAKVKDIYNRESDWSNEYRVTIIENEPPSAPEIEGEINGKAGTEYEYTFNAVDPNDDNVKYHIDWDDGNTETTDFFSSGTDVKVKHTWTNQDTYIIRVTAEDTNGLIGPEGTLTVTMPRNKATNSIGLFRFFKQFPLFQQILLRLVLL